jgi:chaperonin GroES
MKKVKPMFDYLLIKPTEGETTRPSGIVIPDSAKEKPQEGKVISTGPGVKDKDGKLIPMEVSVGAVVMYKKWGGTEIKINGEEHILVKQEDILAVIEE